MDPTVDELFLVFVGPAMIPNSGARQMDDRIEFCQLLGIEQAHCGIPLNVGRLRRRPYDPHHVVAVCRQVPNECGAHESA